MLMMMRGMWLYDKTLCNIIFIAWNFSALDLFFSSLKVFVCVSDKNWWWFISLFFPLLGIFLGEKCFSKKWHICQHEKYVKHFKILMFFERHEKY